MGVVYRINHRDELIACGGDWDRFASENGAPEVLPDRVIGRPLWGFIADRTTRRLYMQLVNWVRGGELIRFSLRCDGPACLRILDMEMSLLPEGSVEFRTMVVAEQPLIPDPASDPTAAGGVGLLRMCGWCGRVDVAGEWADVEVAIRRMDLFIRPSLPGLTHCICDDCLAQELGRLHDDGPSLSQQRGDDLRAESGGELGRTAP